MKKLRLSLLVSIFAMASFTLFAQTPPHPNGGNSPGGSNTPVGGGAPLSGGLIILLSLGFGYAAKRVYDMRKKALE